MYIKVFDKEMRSQGIQYKIGEQYEGNDIILCTNLDETLIYRGVDSRYCLVKPMDVVNIKDYKIITNKIEIIRELTLTELIELQSNTKWLYYVARDIKDSDKKVIENQLLSIDLEGEYLYYFAKEIQGANVKKIEERLLRIKNPKWLYYFAKNITGANISEIIEVMLTIYNTNIFKENVCEWLAYLIKEINVSEIDKIIDKIIEIDETGEWLYYLIEQNVIGIDTIKIKKAMINKDVRKNGKWVYKFYKNFIEEKVS